MDYHDSIILRSGLTMSGIVLLALLSMISSMFIAESSKGDAAAINRAGSLRMQSYRIATRLQYPTGSNSTDHARIVTEEVRAFERRLKELWQTGAIALTADDPRHQTLKTIETFWQETLRLILETSVAGASPPAAYLREVDDFVVKLDAFVKLLEQDTEAKILLLRLVQGLALFMTLVLVSAAMYQLHSRVVTPLCDLVDLAHRARRGDLSVRAQHVGNDELGVLGQAFNLMAADLSTLYANLEARVEAQTQALRVSNHSLELLYHTTRRLGESALDDATYHALLAEIEKLTGFGSVRLCLIDPVARQATRVFITGSYSAKIPPFCQRPYCESCLGDGATHPLAADHATFSIPIRDQQQHFGVLIVRNPGLDSVAAWQLPLLEAVARHIATTLQANQQVEHRRRLALFEERNAMARDLHDSLAQALSYLKIQVARLYGSANSAELTPETRDIIAELRQGLNDAYRQLRELITTFRLKMEHPRLEENVREVACAFSRRSGLPVELDQVGWTCTLNPNEQIHVLQIIREALNNAIKHARAGQVRIRLDGADRGQAVIEITDDGTGLLDSTERDDHFGLAIMRERAKCLGGTLDIESRLGQGARVRLCFQPAGKASCPTASHMEIHHA